MKNSESPPIATGDNIAMIYGKDYSIHRHKPGEKILPRKQSPIDSFRTIIENRLGDKDHIELDKAEMLRARTQISNAIAKAKKAGKPLPYKIAVRTIVRNQRYAIYKIVLLVLLILWIFTIIDTTEEDPFEQANNWVMRSRLNTQLDKWHSKEKERQRIYPTD